MTQFESAATRSVNDRLMELWKQLEFYEINIVELHARAADVMQTSAAFKLDQYIPLKERPPSRTPSQPTRSEVEDDGEQQEENEDAAAD